MTDHSESDVDLVDDEFERLGRLAGAELRQPPPANGPGTVLRSAHRHRAKVAIVAAGVTVAIVMTGLFVATSRSQDEPAPIATSPPNPVPAVVTTAPFVGTWESTDTDGSSQTMDVVGSGPDEYEVVVRDDATTGACAGAAATMTGTGLLETDERLVIAQPELTCDDGTTPAIGPPPQAELANFTFDRDPVADELTDRFGVVWRREGSTTVPPLAAGTSGGNWPQSTLEEVRAAQELADAGDPAYVWQLDANMAAGEEPWGAEIFARFIEEQLGWEAFAGASFAGSIGADGGGQFEGVLFIRCAPGQMNPLSPLYAEAPAEIRGCAPTIDEFTYETVSVNVTQPERRGPSGIWVVDRWEIQSKSDPYSLFGLLYRDYFVPGQAQVDQVAPPSDAEVSALLEAFVRARVDGEDAERYLLRESAESVFDDNEVPLLYATTSGAPYERSEMQRVRGPVWPNGWTEYKVRLFARDDTVVEQTFNVVRRDGQLGLLYGYDTTGVETTENGQSLALPRKEFGDTLTFTSPPLFPRGDGLIEIALSPSSYGRVIIGPDPSPTSVTREDCLDVAIGTLIPRAADTAELARSIEADPDFEIIDTVPVSIAGIDGLQMDITFSKQDLCYELWSPSGNGSGTGPRRVPPGDPEWRMRLYLVDYPESAWPSDSNWRPEVLTVAVIAPETYFERVLEEATPIVESIEFALADGD